MPKTTTSGRYSRFPAVNRAAAAPATAPAPAVAPAPAAEPAPDFAELTVAEVLEWAGDDAGRRAEALAAELAGKNRKSLVEALEG